MTPPIRPYSGVRILDLTFRYGRYATRLFADLGAEVIRVEPPAGLPDRHPAFPGENAPNHAFAFFNASKQSVVVDLDDPAGRRRFDALLAGAHAVFVERDGPLYHEVSTLRAANPGAVITAVSPYGMTGPLADAPASDLTLQAAGGIAWMSGRIEREPLRLPLGQSEMVGSVYAAAATAIALLDAERTGAGHLIDVSVQEAIAHSLQNAIQVYDLEGRVAIRGGEGTRDATEDIFPCRDGYIFLASPPALAGSWRALVAWMVEAGHPAGAEFRHERWADRVWRLGREAKEIFREHFSDFTAGYTKQEITEAAIARRIVMGPVSRIADLLDDEQLAHRNFFARVASDGGQQTVFPGAPYRLSEPVWQLSPAPRLGEHAPDLPEAATVSVRQT